MFPLSRNPGWCPWDSSRTKKDFSRARPIWQWKSFLKARAEIDSRLGDFFANGTRLAWIIDPETQRVEVCHSPIRCQLIGSGGLLEGEDVLPGFQFPIADLFKEWDWD